MSVCMVVANDIHHGSGTSQPLTPKRLHHGDSRFESVSVHAHDGSS